MVHATTDDDSRCVIPVITLAPKVAVTLRGRRLAAILHQLFRHATPQGTKLRCSSGVTGCRSSLRDQDVDQTLQFCLGNQNASPDSNGPQLSAPDPLIYLGSAEPKPMRSFGNAVDQWRLVCGAHDFPTSPDLGCGLVGLACMVRGRSRCHEKGNLMQSHRISRSASPVWVGEERHTSFAAIAAVVVRSRSPARAGGLMGRLAAIRCSGQTIFPVRAGHCSTRIPHGG